MIMDEYFIVTLLKKYLGSMYSGFKSITLDNRTVNGINKNYLVFTFHDNSVREVDITTYVQENNIQEYIETEGLFLPANDNEATIDNTWSASKINQLVSDLSTRLAPVELSTSHVSVKKFGAKGDGVTDDTVAINNCITYCSTNNLIVYFPKSVYRAKNITIKSNTIIDGGFSTIKNTDEKFVNGSTGNLIFSGYVSEISNIKISNLTLDGNSSVLVRDDDINASKGPVLLYLYKCKNVILEDVVLQNNINSALVTYDARNVSVRHCKFINVAGGMSVGGTIAKGIYVSDCRFDGHEYSEPFALNPYDSTVGADVAIADDIVVENCIINNKSLGAGLTIGRGGNDCFYTNIKIVNNTWLNSNNGVNVYSRCENIQILGNTFSLKRAILFSRLANRATICNNVFYSKLEDFVVFTAIAFKGNNSEISNNRFVNVRSATTLTGTYDKTYDVVGMISINGDRNLYRNNTHAHDRSGADIQSITISGNQNIICLNEVQTSYASAKKMNIILGVNYLHLNEGKITEYKAVADSVNNMIYVTGLSSNFTITNCFTDGATASIGSNKVINVLDNTTLAVTYALYGGVVS